MHTHPQFLWQQSNSMYIDTYCWYKAKMQCIKSEASAEHCHGVNQEELCGFEQNAQTFSLTQEKFVTTRSAGSWLFRMPISVLANAVAVTTLHIKITYRKGCSISFPVPSHEPDPGKAPRKLVYLMRNTRKQWRS